MRFVRIFFLFLLISSLLTSPVWALKKGDTALILGKVNVRMDPTKNYSPIGNVYPDEKYRILEIQKGWMKIQYTKVKEGWIAKGKSIKTNDKQFSHSLAEIVTNKQIRLEYVNDNEYRTSINSEINVPNIYPISIYAIYQDSHNSLIRSENPVGQISLVRSDTISLKLDKSYKEFKPIALSFISENAYSCRIDISSIGISGINIEPLLIHFDIPMGPLKYFYPWQKQNLIHINPKIDNLEVISSPNFIKIKRIEGPPSVTTICSSIEDASGSLIKDQSDTAATFLLRRGSGREEVKVNFSFDTYIPLGFLIPFIFVIIGLGIIGFVLYRNIKLKREKSLDILIKRGEVEEITEVREPLKEKVAVKIDMSDIDLSELTRKISRIIEGSFNRVEQNLISGWENLRKNEFKEFEKTQEEYKKLALQFQYALTQLERHEAIKEERDKLDQENTDLREKIRKLNSDNLFISSVNIEKMQHYKEVCEKVMETSLKIRNYILRQEFENGDPYVELNRIVASHLTDQNISFDEIYQLRSDIRNISTYGMTDNNWIRNKFPQQTSITFDKFDAKFIDVIFDYCIAGKVDHLLIGLQEIDNLGFRISLSPKDTNIFQRLCEELEALRKELVRTLKFIDVEPVPLRLLDDTANHQDYIDFRGKISVEEKFPRYNKHTSIKGYLIVEITQWAYRNERGLWRNRKAGVMVSE